MKKYLFLLSILIVSCNTDNSAEKWPVDLDELVELHCLSIEYKNQRFALASSIRYLEDSIIVAEKNNGADSLLLARLDELETKKEVLSEKSYALSDTIEVKIKDLIRELSPEEKRVFNDTLNARTKACL
jgi:hypothetical protein